MTAGLSSYCNSAIPSAMTTFFHTTDTSGETSLEVAVGASFSIKLISALLVEQCNIVPSAAKSDLGTSENSYVPMASCRLISGRDWQTTIMRANKHRLLVTPQFSC